MGRITTGILVRILATFIKGILERILVRIGHFAVMYGTEVGVDLVLIQTFLVYHVNQVILMLTSIFYVQFP